MSISFTRGVVFGLVAVGLWGAQLPMAKTAFLQMDLMAINIARYGIAAIVLTPIFLWREGRAALDDEGRFRHVAIVGVLGMAVSAMLLWNAGNQRIGGLNAALLLNLMPVDTFAVRFAQGQRLLPITVATSRRLRLHRRVRRALEATSFLVFAAGVSAEIDAKQQ